MKWLGTPMWLRRVKTYSLMRLLMTPLPWMVPFFCALNAVASSLEVLDQRPGLGPLVEDLGLAFVDLAATGHAASLNRRTPDGTSVPRVGLAGRGCRVV